jgi:cell division protein FtsZ
LIGKKLLNGFGSGGKAEIGSLAFQESKENLSKIIDGADVLFLIAGLGKGTGSGVTPELAKLAKDKNITTVAIVTLPSISTEGDKVYTNAVVNYEKVKQNSDCICTISNDKILLSDKKLSLIDEFKKGNEEIGSIINDFVDIITETYEFNIDFADLRNFLKENKHFVHLHLRSEENNMKDLKESFEKAIKNSYSSIVFAQDKPVNLLANFKITPKTTSLPKELKDIISAHAKNRNISFVYGLDAENNSLIDISIFASIEEQAIEKSDTSYQKNESEEESMLNETKMIVEQYKTTSVPTVQKNSFSFEMEDDEDNN